MKELRNEIAALSSGGNSPAIEKLRSEKAAVEEQLRVARDERAKLQRDINAIQQQAESSWATERMENALLRERINDIAAEVAKLAIQLEGPEFGDRGHAGRGTGRAESARQTRQRRHRGRPDGRLGRRRHARRTHPGAAVARLPRPPAGGVIRRRITCPIDRLTLRGPALRKSRALTSASYFAEIPGRIAQRESVPFTRERSKVRSLVRPPLSP